MQFLSFFNAKMQKKIIDVRLYIYKKKKEKRNRSKTVM